MKPMVPPLLALAILGVSPPIAAQPPAVPSEELRFAPGTESVTIRGRIRGYDAKDYSIRARAGQMMQIVFRSAQPSAYFNLIGPGADAAMFMGEVKGNRFEGTVPATGSYRVRVFLVRAAARRGAVADFALTVGIRGRPGAERPVPGTPHFDAIADIRCWPAGSSMRSCRAGVMRFPAGEATVRLFLPGNGTRYIYFKDGRATGSDGKGAFSAAVRDGLISVRVGAERYEIPGGLLAGGL